MSTSLNEESHLPAFEVVELLRTLNIDESNEVYDITMGNKVKEDLYKADLDSRGLHLQFFDQQKFNKTNTDYGQLVEKKDLVFIGLPTKEFRSIVVEQAFASGKPSFLMVPANYILTDMFVEIKRRFPDAKFSLIIPPRRILYNNADKFSYDTFWLSINATKFHSDIVFLNKVEAKKRKSLIVSKEDSIKKIKSALADLEKCS